MSYRVHRPGLDIIIRGCRGDDLVGRRVHSSSESRSLCGQLTFRCAIPFLHNRYIPSRDGNYKSFVIQQNMTPQLVSDSARWSLSLNAALVSFRHCANLDAMITVVDLRDQKYSRHPL